MIRKEVVKFIAEEIANEPIISANGFMSRDLYETCEKKSNFYMIGSMGLASSIGLGIALANPTKRVHVFDGDGNILMNLGSLVTIGAMKPKNYIHFIFDNNSHESTGGQPTNSDNLNFAKMGKLNNFQTFQANSKSQIKKILTKIKNKSGPFMLVIKIEKGNIKSKRMEINPPLLRKRFTEYLNKK